MRQKLPAVPGAIYFDVPVYSGRVALCVRQDAYERLHTLLDGEGYPHIAEVMGVTSRHADKNDHVVYLLGVFEGGVSTLVHELTHLALEILTFCDVPVNKKNEEALAYLMGALFELCEEGMKKLSRKAR